MIRAILFDLDGTIIDTELAAQQSILDCAGGWGVPITKADAASVAGQKWEVAFDLLYARYKMPVSLFEASQAITKRYKEIVRAGLKVVPGSVDAVHDFAKHFRLALVTGSRRDDAHWALNHLQIASCFELVLGAEDYRRSKPAPDGYLLALEKMNLKSEEALIFEDSAAGLASAKAAGVRVVAIESTNHFAHDQRGAQARIKDFEGIRADWVQKTFP